MNPQFVPGTYKLQETSPCIDAGDPSNPGDPDDSIADQGALYFIEPLCNVWLLPFGVPITIPNAGGSFEFQLLVENIVDSTVSVNVWTNIGIPTGLVVGPLIEQFNMTLTPGSFQYRNYTQNIPGRAPAGYYIYNAYVGIDPSTEYGEDHFSFNKVIGDGSPGSVNNWNVYGWEVENTAAELPVELSLAPAYPNPFNPETNLSFSLPEAGHVSLLVYDVSGREVAKLYDGWYNAGVHEAIFSAAHLPSGIYFARLTAGDVQETQKLMLVK
jgi:hypothetical protein